MIVDKACFERGCACYDDRVDGPGVEVVKKEWVGLTDEDLRQLADKHLYYQPEGYVVSGVFDFARAIEAAHGFTGEQK